MPSPTSTAPAGRPAPGAMPTAEVTAVDVDPTQPRLLRIRPEAGTTDCPAYLAAGLVLTLGVGARVYFDVVGRRLVVTGAV